MKMIKKILSVSAVAIMTMAMTVSAFAAGTLNSNEEAILAELKAKNVPAEYVSQARNYLESDGVDVTPEQKTTITANIDDAATIAKENKITSVEELKKADSKVLESIMTKVNASASVVGLKVSVDAKTGVVTAKDSTGKVVATTNTGIKTTGADSMDTVAVVSILGLAVVALAVASKKNAQA